MARKRKVLVCGVSGFIGRNVAERLAGRKDVELHGTYLTRKPKGLKGVVLHKADLTDARQAARLLKGVHTVIQAAATTSGAKDIVRRPYIHTTDNAVMNSLLLRAAFEAKVQRYLFFSCTVMYHASEMPLKETDFDGTRELHPKYFASGWTKLYVEKMCEFYSRISPMKVTVVRHSNVYGAHDKYDLERSHVFGATVTKVMTAKDGKVVVWGSGEEARDFLYVDDMVDFVEAALERQQAAFELYNAGSGQAVSVRSLVERVIAASGRRLRVEHDLNGPTIKTSFCLDSGKARTQLGWSPKVALDEGIRRTLEWYRAHKPVARP